jgi:hypothetical protein
MNPTEIDALVEQSLAGLRSVYVHHVPDPQSYVESIRLRFIEKRVSATPRFVVIEPHISHLVSLPPGEHQFYFVTDDDPQSVFFDPNCNLFGCAWGPELPSLRYVDLGFRSKDVLEMASA